MRIITDHIDQISELCSANGLKALFAFGSVTNDKFSTGSDVDLVVEIANTDPLGYSDSYFNLKFGLEALLQREIDLLENKRCSQSLCKRGNRAHENPCLWQLKLRLGYRI